MADNEVTYHKYWKEVARLAEDITSETFEELEPDEKTEALEDPTSDPFQENLNERLHETIDGHQWVIYTAYNFDVLKHSPNDDYSVVNFGADSIVNDAGLNTAVLAYGALYADVEEHSAFGVLKAEE